jgi:hypothetical protein
MKNLKMYNLVNTLFNSNSTLPEDDSGEDNTILMIVLIGLVAGVMGFLCAKKVWSYCCCFKSKEQDALESGYVVMRKDDVDRLFSRDKKNSGASGPTAIQMSPSSSIERLTKTVTP